MAVDRTNGARTRAMIAELQRRATYEFGEGAEPSDAIIQFIEEGRTLRELADELTQATMLKVTRAMISKYINAGEVRRKRMAEAKVEGASAMVDDAIQILDESGEDRDELNKNKARADIRLKVAAFNDRAKYGQQAQAGQTINIGTLHLTAHRERLAATQRHALGAGEEIAVIEAEIVSEALEAGGEGASE